MTTSKPIRPEHLRADAEGRLRTGTAPATAGWAVEAEALSLLYRLASDPNSSADALKLLHELQTHQVELDLQHAQLTENEHDLASQFTHFQTLYEHAPAGYLVIDREGRILQSNRTASQLLGLDADHLKDQMLTSLLSPESKSSIRAALENTGTGDTSAIIQVKALGARPLGLLTGLAPGEEANLVLIFPLGAIQES